MAAPNIKISGYTVYSELGRGGMATVYMATQESLNRKVAIKVLRQNGDASINERFESEAHYVASLNHPNIITIYDIAKLANGEHYIAMEYLPGGDLKSKLDAFKAPEKAITLVKHIAKGLSVVHDKGIIHRDIKPANILFRENGDAVLTDFGIAKSASNDSDLTQVGISVGSPSYSSPEQVRGKPVTPATDIYSLGVVLLELLLGNNCFRGDSPSGTAINHIQMPLPDLPLHLTYMEGFLSKMLAKKIEDRYQTCDELLDAIALLQKQTADNKNTFKLHKPDKSNTHSPPTEGSSSDSIIAFTSSRIRLISITAILLAMFIFLFFVFYENETDRKINTLLSHAERKIESKDFILPKNDNARYYYRQVLLLDDNNRDAIKGIERVEREQIDHYISSGSKALEEQRLDTPEFDNAIYYFQQVLILDENNDAAQTGLHQVADEYLKSARSAFLKNEFRQASKYLSKGLTISPDNEALRSLQEEIKSQSLNTGQKLKGIFKKLRDKL